MTPLAALIAEEIRANGPISLARYMELCLLHPQHGTASRALDAARKTEAQAKARLRKACAAADPASLTLEVEACEVIEAATLLA